MPLGPLSRLPPPLNSRPPPLTPCLPAGFCPNGPDCKFAHPQFALPVLTPRNEGPTYGGTGAGIGGGGDAAAGGGGGGGGGGDLSGARDFASVTCFKCWEKGHYANRCPNGRRENPQPAGQGGGGAPQPGENGNWLCPACSNVNFPMRIVCNRCKAPRPDRQAGGLGGGGGGPGGAGAGGAFAGGQQSQQMLQLMNSMMQQQQGFM